MITKAIITKVPNLIYNDRDNKYTIRIPLFEDTFGSIYETKATLCYQPEVRNGYQVGDVVFIGFEDNYYDKPVILGKLFLQDNISESSYVKSSAIDTTKLTTENLNVFGKDFSAKDINIALSFIKQLSATYSVNRVIELLNSLGKLLNTDDKK